MTLSRFSFPFPPLGSCYRADPAWDLFYALLMPSPPPVRLERSNQSKGEKKGPGTKHQATNITDESRGASNKRADLLVFFQTFVPTHLGKVLCYSICVTTRAHGVSVSAAVWELGAEDGAFAKRLVLPPNSCGASFVLFGGPVAPALFRAFTPVSLTSHSLGSSSQVIN